MPAVLPQCRLLILSVCVLPVAAFLRHYQRKLQQNDPESLRSAREDDGFVAATLSRLWLGEDLNEDELKALATSPPSLRLHSKSVVFESDAKTAAPVIHVVGMFGSGTNLMEEYLHQNDFKLIARRADESWVSLDTAQECEENEASRKTLTCDAFWKHTHPARIEDFSSDAPVVVVAMVRNPFTQFLSWRRQPFNLHTCFTHPYDACECLNHCDGYHCMDHPLGFPCGGVGEGSQAEHLNNFKKNLSAGDERLADSANTPYSNVLGVWNMYTEGYSRLLQQDLPVKALVVRYEDLVLGPEATLQRVADWLQISNRSNVTNIDENARTFDAGASGRDEAVQKIKTKSYRKELMEAEIQHICGSLDPKLLDNMTYSDECKPSSA